MLFPGSHQTRLSGIVNNGGVFPLVAGRFKLESYEDSLAALPGALVARAKVFFG